ncbi:hypothetical protein E3P81_00939 [Wallemia ichthyophaga]|nr:hypothetical protein E3P97_00940 [Wallemia ichthyophaga]TIB34724.1 hypothetical protein E3P85_00794 [Wallemia ichthyophaga]TIB49278.1 hypothetical protein E3P82_00937 [Wallemia ichthyophaga]TIB53167.1 hypothetical protein E3P81_00939 [Wallemia ichthyophaga]TIB55933.1 hypothetical protein E3P80_00938 [Wallemia ichthyophaga]
MAKLTPSSTIKLNNGAQHPVIGLGTYLLKDSASIAQAINTGYKALDTACFYHNHKEFGKGVRDSGVPRESLYLISKVDPWTGTVRNARQSILQSLQDAQVGYWDLVLVHSPSGGKSVRMGAYQELSTLVEEGKIRSLGVSNYGVKHIEELLNSKPKYTPVVNQVEVHTMHSNSEVVEWCKKQGILVQAYCPLARCRSLKDERIGSVAEKHGATNAQVMLAWLIGRGLVPLPKSGNKERQQDNLQSLKVELSDEDNALLNSLDMEMDVDGQFMIQSIK